MSSSDNTVSIILEYINEELLFGEGEALVDEDLLEAGLLDSISIFGVVQFVRDTFGVEVPPQDIVIEHFGSVGQMATYVSQRLSEAA
jgi:acyl carrier protein